MVSISRKYNTPLKRVLEVLPQVYQITLGGANIVLIAEKEMTLVDTGFPGGSAQVVDLINRLGRSAEEIGLIILTHNHFDHAGGLLDLKKLSRAKVAGHRADFNSGDGPLPYPGMVQKLLRLRPFSALRWAFSLKPDAIDTVLAGGEVLSPLGGLEVIHTPGHTPGSISLYSPARKLLIAGDALNKRRDILRLPPKMASTDLTQAIDSVEKIAGLDFDTLCLGHGRPLTVDVHARLRELMEKNRRLTMSARTGYH